MPEDAPLAQAAQQLISAFNTLPETECSGLFPAKSLLNHSCDANAAIEWRHDSSLLTIVAKRPIAKGEEVCHCYIALQEHHGLHARRRALEAHSRTAYGGFICDCPLCTEEAAALATRPDASE